MRTVYDDLTVNVMSHSGGKCWINRWTVAVLAAEKLENRKESDLWPGDVHHS